MKKEIAIPEEFLNAMMDLCLSGALLARALVGGVVEFGGASREELEQKGRVFKAWGEDVAYFEQVASNNDMNVGDTIARAAAKIVLENQGGGPQYCDCERCQTKRAMDPILGGVIPNDPRTS